MMQQSESIEYLDCTHPQKSGYMVGKTDDDNILVISVCHICNLYNIFENTFKFHTDISFLKQEESS